MKRGSLIIYDNTGKIWINTGDAEGNVLPNEPPIGLPYIETQFGELDNKIVIGVDVNTNTLITEDIKKEVSKDEKIEELENQLLLQVDSDLGGIL